MPRPASILEQVVVRGGECSCRLRYSTTSQFVRTRLSGMGTMVSDVDCYCPSPGHPSQITALTARFLLLEFVSLIAAHQRYVAWTHVIEAAGNELPTTDVVKEKWRAPGKDARRRVRSAMERIAA